MRLAIAYSTKDRVELTKQTCKAVMQPRLFDLFWVDGSETQEGYVLPAIETGGMTLLNTTIFSGITGGADAAIVFKLTAMLRHENNYTHVGLLENDVLLDPDWLEPTLALFDRGWADGLDVGAVSARSYVDRVLIQRDGYAVMHNLGAGMVIFTRQAAELVLQNFRTGWWPSLRSTWMRMAGIDIGRYAAFRSSEQWVTSDWHWDALLASNGFASLALTPAKCQMIGQDPPLEQQGLQLTTDELNNSTFRDQSAFDLFVERTRAVRQGTFDCNSPVQDIDPCIGGSRIVFPHLAPVFGATYSSNWRLQWSQGFGPFAYRAGEGGASLIVPCYGTCSFLVSGGAAGARFKLNDAASGYAVDQALPPEAQTNVLSMIVPGNVTYRDIHLELSEGGVFYGYSSPEQQPWNPTVDFTHATLPPV